ncbi:hypothetical protein RQP46_011357 [Phenoliferia psychrophenolica]
MTDVLSPDLPSYQPADPPIYEPSTPPETSDVASVCSAAASQRGRVPTFPASQAGFYIHTPNNFKDFAVMDLVRSHSLSYFAHTTKIFKGWESTLCTGKQGGPTLFRFRKPMWGHDIEVLSESASTVTTLKPVVPEVKATEKDDPSYTFIGSDGQSTIVWTSRTLYKLAASWKCTNRKSGLLLAEWIPTPYTTDGALLIQDASAVPDADLLLATFLAIERALIVPPEACC